MEGRGENGQMVKWTNGQMDKCFAWGFLDIWLFDHLAI
jgi:hypothetical protein